MLLLFCVKQSKQKRPVQTCLCTDTVVLVLTDISYPNRA